MDLARIVPITLFVGTLAVLLYLRYRDYASLTPDDRRRISMEKAAHGKGKSGGKMESWPEQVNELMPAFVTAVVLLSSIYIVLSNDFGEDKNKWAYGSIGMILGYWLRSTVKGSGPLRKGS